jgi:hypothetical protein
VPLTNKIKIVVVERILIEIQVFTERRKPNTFKVGILNVTKQDNLKTLFQIAFYCN